jgi:hypothetical protein
VKKGAIEMSKEKLLPALEKQDRHTLDVMAQFVAAIERSGADASWLFFKLIRMANAHVETVKEVLGVPAPEFPKR